MISPFTPAFLRVEHSVSNVVMIRHVEMMTIFALLALVMRLSATIDLRLSWLNHQSSVVGFCSRNSVPFKTPSISRNMILFIVVLIDTCGVV